MVRAAALGAIDFASADLNAKRWWRKLTWIIDELGAQQRRQVLLTQHSHWATLFSRGSQNKEYNERTQDNAVAALQEYAQASYPWLKLDAVTATSSAEAAVAAWHETWGWPGDPQYEEMMVHNDRLIAEWDHTDAWRKRQEQKHKDVANALRDAV